MLPLGGMRIVVSVDEHKDIVDMKEDEFYGRCRKVLPQAIFTGGYVEGPQDQPFYIGYGNSIVGELYLQAGFFELGFTLTLYSYPFTFEETRPRIIEIVKKALPEFDFEITDHTDRRENPLICFSLPIANDNWEIEDPICRWRLTEMTDSPTSNTNSFKNSIPLRMRCTPRKGYQINFGGAAFEVVSFGETPDKQGIYDVCVKRLM